jgi:hypothetical protein
MYRGGQWIEFRTLNSKNYSLINYLMSFRFRTNDHECASAVVAVFLLHTACLGRHCHRTICAR